MPRRFRDRVHAGVELAERLAAYKASRGFRGSDGIVLGLPRGGVAVAAPVAHALDLAARRVRRTQGRCPPS